MLCSSEFLLLTCGRVADEKQYLVMTWNAVTGMLVVQHYSPGVIDMLCHSLPDGTMSNVYNKDIFKVLSEFATTSSAASVHKALKQTVRDSLKEGQAVSVEIDLLTGFEGTKKSGLFGGEKERMRRVEEGYVTHWTPLKDQESVVKWVVLTIAPKVQET